MFLSISSGFCATNSLQADGKSSWSLLRPYHPNYIMPYYYTQSPDQEFDNINPSGTPIKRNEFKFQLSIQVPVFHHIFFPGDGFSFAYTQMSYWQAYSQSAYFRETNYEPELFYYVPDIKRFHGIKLERLQMGFYHQSNGRGGENERKEEMTRQHRGYNLESSKAYVSLYPTGDQSQYTCRSLRPGKSSKPTQLLLEVLRRAT